MVRQPKREILINTTPYDKRIAIIENGELSEIVSESLESNRVLSNIYKGVVQKVLPGLQAAFVEIGLEKAGFLHVDDVIDRNYYLNKEFGDEDDDEVTEAKPTIDQLLQEGQEIVVQITKEPISTKGARLTTHLNFPGRFLVCMPGTNFIGVSKKERDYQKRRGLKKLIRELKSDDVGYIVRTNGLNESESELKSQMKALEEKWNVTQESIKEETAPALVYQESNAIETTMRDYFSDNTDFVYIDDKEEYKTMRNYLKILSPDKLNKVRLWSSSTSLFEQFRIERAYESTLHKHVRLKSGGYLVIEQTEALCSIDVNTGPKVHGASQAKNILETNIDAAHEIAHQLRLRDQGGLIVIDFIDMESEEHQEQVVNEFKKAIRKDKAPISFTGLSQFGLMEVTRKRVRSNILTEKTKICKACFGKGLTFSQDSILAEIDRWLARCKKAKRHTSVSLVLSSTMIDFLLDNRNLYLNYLTERHGIELELYEHEKAFDNEFHVFDNNQEEITDLYTFSF